MSVPVIVFDLDGTLIDSAPDLHAASVHMLLQEGVPPLPRDQIRSFIGNGVPALVDRIIEATGLEAAQRERLIHSFLDDYYAHCTVQTRLYPHVVNVVQLLKDQGARLGLCTNKPYASTVKILQAFGLVEMFDKIAGGDSFPMRKPDPCGLLSIFAELGPGPCVFVGDSAVDAETAKRAKVPFGFHTNGYLNGPSEELQSAFRFSSFLHLPELVCTVFENQDALT